MTRFPHPTALHAGRARGASPRLAIVHVLTIATLCAFSLPGRTASAASHPPPLVRGTNRDGLTNALATRLGQAPAGAGVDVVVTFRLPLAAIDYPVLQAQIGAFAPARPLHLVRAVATRLNRAQIIALARSGIVEQIEADETMYALDTPAQKYFGVTQARASFGLTGDGDGQPDVFTPQDNTIAIIDTGIDAGHVELNGGKVIGWKDFVNNRPDPYDDSTRTVSGKQVTLGHGTHVASIAAGKVSGDQSGVAPGAALVGVKVLDGSGAGALSTVAQGIGWCVDHAAEFGIRVINLSLGASTPSSGDDVVSKAVDAAVDAGITVVCAAGNSGPGQYSIGSPGAARKALTVGAAADPDAGGVYVPSFSSRGPTLDGRIKPDILAPGVNITAALAGSTDQFVTYTGTSMATPFVTGLVALLLQQDPSRTPADIYNRITATARDFGPPGLDIDFGYGLVDGLAALRPADRMVSPGPPRFPGLSEQTGAITSSTRSVTHSINVASTDFPVAVTLVIPAWFFGSPDLDMELRDPTGAVVAISNSTTRQETITWKPKQAGIYTLRVYGYRSRDRGNYLFEVSGDFSGGGPPSAPSDGSPPG